MRLYYLANRQQLIAASLRNRENDKERYKQVAKERHKRTYVPIPPKLHKKSGAVRADGMRSGFERTLATQLKSTGTAFEYESLPIKYTLEGTYWPDFILSNGIIIEAKGLLDKDSKRKMLAVKAQHPELDVRFVFMVANKKIPGGKQTHAQWATRHGFKWADGVIPEEWLNDKQ